MKHEISDGLKRWNDFTGRSTRKQFWWFTGFFLVLPILLQAPLWIAIILFAPALGNLLPFLIISYAWIILIPAQISINVRRLHDVGKSGWLSLVPIYNLYLYIQPSIENGRIPFWSVVEKVALAFIFLPLLGLVNGDIFTSIGGSITWLTIYLAIKWFNDKVKRKNAESD